MNHVWCKVKTQRYRQRKQHYRAVNYLCHFAIDIVLKQLQQIVNVNTKRNYSEIKKQLLVSVESK